MPNKRRRTSQEAYSIPEEDPFLPLDINDDGYDDEMEYSPLISPSNGASKMLEEPMEIPLMEGRCSPVRLSNLSPIPFAGMNPLMCPLEDRGGCVTPAVETNDPGGSSSDQQLSVYEIYMNEQARERQDLMETLNGAPAKDLGQLTLVSRLEWYLPMNTITNILRSATMLQTLSLYSVAFRGDEHDFAGFCDCLKNHTSLKEIHLVDCFLVDQTIQIDPLLHALAVIPTLEKVELYAMDLERDTSLSLMSPASLGELCGSPTIISLSLEDLDLNDDHLEELAASMLQNITMKHLTLWDCNVSDNGGRMLANVIEANACLEKMDVSFNDLGDAGYRCMATALSSNETLKSLSLHGNIFLKNMNARSDLQEDDVVAQCTDKSSGYETLVCTLRDQNQVLEELILDTQEEDPRIGLYLTINHNRQVLEDDNATREQLVDCLAEYNRNEGKHMSFVFHVLQSNPQLCELNR